MILVTGSTGHLGEALVRRLREEGTPVRGLDCLAGPFTDVVGSIVDRALVARATGESGYHGESYPDGLYPVQQTRVRDSDSPTAPRTS
jgi:nucleoside-diphosphate-sugar epimerase